MALKSLFKDYFISDGGSRIPNPFFWSVYYGDGTYTTRSQESAKITSNGLTYNNSSDYKTTTYKTIDFLVADDGIVIECLMSDAYGGYDYGFGLVEKNNFNNRIQVGVTTFGGQGVYSYGTGSYNLSQIGAGYSTNSLYWYRLTIIGTSLKIERSSDRNSWATITTRTLSDTVNGKTFFFYFLSHGVGPYYSGIYRFVEIFGSKARFNFIKPNIFKRISNFLSGSGSSYNPAIARRRLLIK